MKKTLILDWEDSDSNKSGVYSFDISDEESENKAYVYIFKFLSSISHKLEWKYQIDDIKYSISRIKKCKICKGAGKIKVSNKFFSFQSATQT